mmetsp:Transcript_103293/g.267101  ORF Transcript_103293/g.267101 Transcript_103293/m.267101 type:complete len:507 (+) Transcript_103293:73-1593(+)
MSWALLHEDMGQAAVLKVGGKCLGDTSRLREVSHIFRIMADRAFHCHLHGSDAEMRLVALQGVVAAAEHGSEAALQRVLERASDEDATVRQAALNALGYLVIRGDDEVPAVVKAAAAALSDDSAEVSAAALSLLMSVADRGDRAAVAAVVAAAAPGGTRRPEALGALGAVAERGDEEVVGAIIEALGDSCEEVCREAVAALGEVAAHGCDEATRTLSELIMDPDPFTCQAALTACAAIAPRGHQGAVRAFTARLEDHRPAVRGKALEALGVVAEPGAEMAAALAPLLQDPDDHVRGIAQRVAERLAPPAEEVEPIHLDLAKPQPIEGVKSKKAALLKLEQEAAKGGDSVSVCLTLSLSSRVVLAGQQRSHAMAMLAGEAGDDGEADFSCWRHKRTRIASVSQRSLGRLAGSEMTPVEFLLASQPSQASSSSASAASNDDDAEEDAKPEARESDAHAAASHLARFGLGAGAMGGPISSLPRELKGLLAMVTPRPLAGRSRGLWSPTG